MKFICKLLNRRENGLFYIHAVREFETLEERNSFSENFKKNNQTWIVIDQQKPQHVDHPSPSN